MKLKSMVLKLRLDLCDFHVIHFFYIYIYIIYRSYEILIKERSINVCHHHINPSVIHIPVSVQPTARAPPNPLVGTGGTRSSCGGHSIGSKRDVPLASSWKFACVTIRT